MDITKDKDARQRRWSQPNWLGSIGLFGLLGLLHPALEPLRVLLLFSLLHLVLLIGGWVWRLYRPPRAEVSEPINFPLPGPAERKGAGWFLGRYWLASLLVVFNPLQLSQGLLQQAGQLVAWMRWRGRPGGAAAHRSSVRYSLPVQGEWLVYNGGDTPESSHSWSLLAQRYASDLVVADAAGRRNRPGEGERVEDYFCYGLPVVAPADGVVVRVRDGVRDAPAPGSGWIDWLCSDFRGNFVIIRHAEGEYSFLAHLIPGQIAVCEGQRVIRGELIGRCGNSGHSTEPHLHFHLQDHPNVFLAMGLPIRFDDVVLEGEQRGGVLLTRGMRVVGDETRSA